MPIDKYASYVHPYFSRVVRDEEDDRSEIVGAALKKDQFIEFNVILHGCERDSFMVFQYLGEAGKITGFKTAHHKDLIRIQNEVLGDTNDVLFYDLKTYDLITIYHGDKYQAGKYSVTVTRIVNGKSEVLTYQLKPANTWFRKYIFPFESGKIIKADISPCKIKINNDDVESLDNIDLKLGDNIVFMPDILYFEANIAIRCPVKEV